MTPTRKKRLLMILLMVLGLSTATALVLTAFRDNIMYYRSPSDIKAGDIPNNRNFRIGGMVKTGTFVKATDSLKSEFIVTDYAAEVSIVYEGILPDLFREDQGVVAIGRINEGGVFVAEEILAKHDENYMPPEVAASLKKES
ncbi:cytochrome c maturation protein CcmE [Marinicella sp. W31]|uniref:cytochrome c maturation protein CcmE n=1 Tax=Marinicella sp. W31 TaxID=3023713 RepID=UPI003757E97F